MRENRHLYKGDLVSVCPPHGPSGAAGKAATQVGRGLRAPGATSKQAQVREELRRTMLLPVPAVYLCGCQATRVIATRLEQPDHYFETLLGADVMSPHNGGLETIEADALPGLGARRPKPRCGRAAPSGGSEAASSL